MSKSPRFSPEECHSELLEARDKYPSLRADTESVYRNIGCALHTLCDLVHRYDVDDGMRNGVDAAERELIKDQEREVKEFRRFS